MPFDQGTAERLIPLLSQFFREEAAEGHHPPNPQQHQQVLGAPGGGTDINEPPGYPSNAGGMLLMAPDGRALFVRRAQNARDHAGMWSIPGGMTEGDELPWQTALRETHEEVGDVGNPEMTLVDHNVMDGTGFTTFAGRVNDAFTPQLNEEHDAFQWANVGDAPQPLHPGLQSTIKFHRNAQGLASDPLTEKGSKIMSSMKQQYGPEKGERVFYASKNKGTISGVDDSYVTTGRQDTQIPRPHPVNPHIDNPFNANVDAGAGWASPAQPMAQPLQTAPNSAAPPPARRSHDAGMGGHEAAEHLKVKAAPGWMSSKAGTTTHPGIMHHSSPQRSPESTRGPGAPHMHASHKTGGQELGDAGWASPTQGNGQTSGWASPRMDSRPLTATTTPAKAMSPAARKPVAATAGSHEMVPGRRVRQSGGDAGWASPSQRPVSDYQRFKLYDEATDTKYAIDQPLPAEFTPITSADEVTEDAGGGAGGWGHPGLAPPTQAGANVGDAGWAGGSTSSDPTEPAGTPSIRPPQPPSGVGGGMRGGTSQHMPGSPMGMASAGPKMQHSVRYSYPDGTIDEHKITRPGGPSMGAQPQQAGWQSPQFPNTQQNDAGWLNTVNLGQSPKGGRAGSRAGGAGI